MIHGDFERVEFVPLGAARVLVVIVARGGQVIQKVIEVGEPLGADTPKTRCCTCDDGDFASETTHVPQGS